MGATIQEVSLPGGTVLEVRYSVTFGEILIAALLALGVVLWFGGWLHDRIRGVL